ncbi:MAG: alpha/beta hydrolase [Hyphomonas sp.]|nr:alpha/beta hydrolase [Hyphomonas sp.]
MIKFPEILLSGVAALALALMPLSACAHADPVMAESAPDLTGLSYDKRLTNYDYAFDDVRMFSLHSQGQALEMAYIYRPGDTGMPVVTLMHGKNFNADYWKTTSDHLQGLGYGVLIPDQIGFGKSSRPESYQYSFAALASHTHALMDSLGIEKSIVLGHSMGGMLASRFALMYPDTVDRLILLNPIGLENYLEYTQYKDTEFFYEQELSKTAESIAAYQKKNYYDGAWNANYEALTHHLIGQAQGPDSKAVAWVNALTYDMIFTQPVVTDFPNLDVPTSLILGTRDRTGPGRGWMREDASYELGRYDQLGKRTVALIPQADLIELEGLGHSPHIEAFDRFVIALDQALAKAE